MYMYNDQPYLDFIMHFLIAKFSFVFHFSKVDVAVADLGTIAIAQHNFFQHWSLQMQYENSNIVSNIYTTSIL